jgi:hypothetical protein
MVYYMLTLARLLTLILIDVMMTITMDDCIGRNDWVPRIISRFDWVRSQQVVLMLIMLWSHSMLLLHHYVSVVITITTSLHVTHHCLSCRSTKATIIIG